jgi:hypothetical protein
MTWLVLCQDHDIEAGWIADGLRSRAGRPVERITAGALVHDCRWEHRVSATDTSSRLVVGDGTVVDSAEVDGVLNRICWMGAEGFGGASDRDAEYAGSELFALGLSWLASLGPKVLNRPTGLGLAGGWRTEGQWRSLARSVGLPILAYERGGTEPDPPAVPGDDGDGAVLVLDGLVLEEAGVATTGVTSPLWSGLAELQRASGRDLIEVHLAVGDGIAVRSVSYLPSLRRFGDAALDAVHEALDRRSAVR